MHWDHYWDSTNRLSSFGDAETELGYPEEILTFWENYIRSKNNGCSYLDLATGKGALAIWLQSVLTKHHLNGTVAGCDLANIAPSKITSNAAELNAAIATIDFKFNTSLEALPYENNSFDVLVSQFGFEYSDWSKSLPEALRVLKNQGEIILMMHHPHSLITNDCKSGLNILHRLIKANIVDDLIEVVGQKLAGNTKEYEYGNQQIIKKIQAIAINTTDEQVWFLDVVSKISKVMVNVNTHSLAKLTSLKAGIYYQIERLDDQLSVAFDESDIRSKLLSSG
ncbi:class I SAM-dependent methyltransferase, partial [Pseudoalteromonas sp.]|uniref:class I SAM-dependent methyltransferase n=1 Tax=Pseudoalteromonas sp. TaxID=53249 RepID=UPI003563BAD1